jgi:hypothetical protein
MSILRLSVEAGKQQGEEKMFKKETIQRHKEKKMNQCPTCMREIEDRDDRMFPLVIIACIMAILILSLAYAPKANAETIPDSKKIRMINAIIGEAEGEGYKGMLAVSCAIRNRGTLKGVYGEHAPRVKNHKYSQKTFVLAVKAYEESKDPIVCGFIGGANHWEGTSFSTPAWSKRMKTTAVIGKQRFFKG